MICHVSLWCHFYLLCLSVSLPTIVVGISTCIFPHMSLSSIHRVLKNLGLANMSAIYCNKELLRLYLSTLQSCPNYRDYPIGCTCVKGECDIYLPYPLMFAILILVVQWHTGPLSLIGSWSWSVDESMHTHIERGKHAQIFVLASQRLEVPINSLCPHFQVEV